MMKTNPKSNDTRHPGQKSNLPPGFGDKQRSGNIIFITILSHLRFYPGLQPMSLHITRGRNRIYPPGLMRNNIPRISFSSQSCHNYDSTPGTRVEIKLSPLEKVCLGLDLSLFDFLKTKTTKKTSKEPLQPLKIILESDVRSSTFLCNVFHPISCRLSTLSIIS